MRAAILRRWSVVTVNQKERCGDVMLFGVFLVRFGYRRYQFSALAQHLKGTRLCFTSYEVEHCISVPYFIFKSLGLIVHYLVRTKGPHIVDVSCAYRRYGTQVRPASKLESKRSDVSAAPWMTTV